MMKKVVVLVSGHGSNLQAIIDACLQGRINGSVCAVLSDNPTAYALQRAADAGIPAIVCSRRDYANKQAFDAALQQQIDSYQPDLILLAGYMRILSPAIVHHFAGRLLNIHPSLLPRYPGLHTHRQALENGDAEHGTSVHFVTEVLDGGPVILQAKVPIFADDSEEEVQARVQAQEHAIYPLVAAWFIDERLRLSGNTVWLDNQPLPAQGYAAD